MSAASPVSIVKRHAARHGVFFVLPAALLLSPLIEGAEEAAGVQVAQAAPLAADAVAAALAEVERLAQAGASGLALALADARQPAFAGNPVDWLRWERRRVQLLTEARRWQALLERIDAAPAAVPADFRVWLEEQRVRALRALGRRTEAVDALRRLLWQAPPEVADTRARQRWRALLIRLYLDLGEVEDARLALQRYRQDYGDGDDDSRRLAAEVLLRADAPAEAFELIGEATDSESAALRLLAGLRSGRLPASEVARSARRLATREKADPERIPLYWDILVQAHAGEPDEAVVDAMERALVPRARRSPFARVDGDRLWQAWLELGRTLGNSQQLLMGEDDKWYFAATEALDRQPVRARAFFAVLAETASEPRRRELAHDYLAASLEGHPNAGNLLLALYLESDRFDHGRAVPASVDYRIVDRLIARGRLREAAARVARIPEPPPGAALVDWQLRRARVFILGGRQQDGVTLLRGLVEGPVELDADQRDRLVQVIFDLQQLRADEPAVALLRGLLARETDATRRRELLFWMAESEQRLGNPREAARLYLESAMALDPHALDPWSQTARYHAARALAEAGLPGDAAGVLEILLRATRDLARRRVLMQELQRYRQQARLAATEAAP